MNIALITAGGKGQRMNQEIPKQFLTIYEKPVIIYTLEAFQRHPEIDAIEVVCIDSWKELLRAYARQYQIDKLRWIVPGGETGQESIYNGVSALENICKPDDIVMIHDGNRPFVSTDIISDCVVKCRAYGSALAAMPCQETIIRTEDGLKGNSNINRWEVMRVQTPQAFRYDKLLWAHREAVKRGIKNAVATNTIMVELGETVYFSLGSEKNMKLTTQDDMDIFKALLHKKE